MYLCTQAVLEQSGALGKVKSSVLPTQRVTYNMYYSCIRMSKNDLCLSLITPNVSCSVQTQMKSEIFLEVVVGQM